MYAYEWDASTGGFVLTPMPLAFSNEPRPIYYQELDIWVLINIGYMIRMIVFHICGLKLINIIIEAGLLQN